MGKSAETVTHDGQVLALIVRDDHEVSGIEFLSPSDYNLQLGQMRRPAGHRVVPHIHNPVERKTVGTQEVLFVKSGSLRVDFYSLAQEFLESRTIKAGDLILLAGGGHGMEFLEDSTVVEVKNGPYVEGADKGRFEGRREA